MDAQNAVEYMHTVTHLEKTTKLPNISVLFSNYNINYNKIFNTKENKNEEDMYRVLVNQTFQNYCKIFVIGLMNDSLYIHKNVLIYNIKNY